MGGRLFASPFKFPILSASIGRVHCEDGRRQQIPRHAQQRTGSTMKIAFRFMSLAIIGLSALVALGAPQKEAVEYVSPNIGGIGQLLTPTIPYVQRPHGMSRLAPMTTPGINDRYLADKIYGFPAGSGMLMASEGDASTRAAAYASDFDHDFEKATPYYYAVNLESWSIRAEFTASREAAYYRFMFPAAQHAHLVLSIEKNAQIEVLGNKAVLGSQRL